MCGIAGIVGPHSRGIEIGAVKRMQDLLRHRGPDGEGVYADDNAILAMRRLAIIDIEGGDQPMSNEDGTVSVVSNGEIYNFRELRDRLAALGHRFATNSDTEVIVHAYEQYGTDCPALFRGMFAFAVWDKARQRLFLARDRVGKKPLLYCEVGDRLIFASEFAALLSHPDVSRDVDDTAIHHYLSFMCVPAPLTAYRGIRKLEPAHSLTWERGRVRIQRYWSLSFGDKLRLTEKEAEEQLTSIVRDAVRARMISDVPIGAFLSGGIDSSTVVAFMAAESTAPVKTFSIGFDKADFDELRHARRVANHLGTDHHEFVVTPDAAEVLPLLVRHYGEPYADSSAIPTYYVSRETRRYVTVALNGDGGDEAFAGYERYVAMQLADRAPAVFRRTARLARFLPALALQRSRLRDLKRFLEAAALPRDRRYLRLISAFDSEGKRELYHEAFASRLMAPDSLTLVSPLLHVDGDGAIDGLLRTETLTYLPNDLLVKVDIASMAVSLEARSPLLDHQVLEFAARLPEEMKLRGLTTKRVLRRAMAGRLPKENLTRRKMGFGVPVGHWLRSSLRDLMQDALLSERAVARRFFKRDMVRNLMDEHLSARQDHTNRLWTLMMLELWFREFIDREPVAAPDCDLAAVALPQ